MLEDYLEDLNQAVFREEDIFNNPHHKYLGWNLQKLQYYLSKPSLKLGLINKLICIEAYNKCAANLPNLVSQHSSTSVVLYNTACLNTLQSRSPSNV